MPASISIDFEHSMSQKSGRRSRRPTTEEDTELFKAPATQANGENGPETIKEETPNEGHTTPELNGKSNGTNEDLRVTRSRSQTPQKKKAQEEETRPEDEQEDLNGHKEDDVVAETTEPECQEGEMDPLIVVDETDPELIFEESDLESGKESPVLNRCQTRRSSSSRENFSPKTPDDEESDLKDVSFESYSENLSTKVTIGSDSTRLEYADKDFSLESNSFLSANRNKSFAESLRHLSTRRAIRPISDTHRKALQNNLAKTEPDAQTSFTLKRKHCNGSEVEAKRVKTDSPGFFARLSSPLASFRRNNFKPDIVSSTPKLTGYKDEKCLLEDEIESKVCEIKDTEKRWCVVM